MLGVKQELSLPRGGSGLADGALIDWLEALSVGGLFGVRTFNPPDRTPGTSGVASKFCPRPQRWACVQRTPDCTPDCYATVRDNHRNRKQPLKIIELLNNNQWLNWNWRMGNCKLLVFVGPAAVVIGPIMPMANRFFL